MNKKTEHLVEMIGGGLVCLIVVYVLFVMPHFESDTRESASTPARVLPPLTAEVKTQLASSKGFQALVSYTESGFEPQTLHIKSGDTIRFTNNSSIDLWVASDKSAGKLYPASSARNCSMSAFDTCHPIHPREFWEFTFSHAGTWSYHNNGNASSTGIITVQ